jgi:hypothetical protein
MSRGCREGQTECAPTFEPGVGVAHFDTSIAILKGAVLDLLERVLCAEGIRPPARAMRYLQKIAAERHLRERYSQAGMQGVAVSRARDGTSLGGHCPVEDVNRTRIGGFGKFMLGYRYCGFHQSVLI